MKTASVLEIDSSTDKTKQFQGQLTSLFTPQGDKPELRDHGMRHVIDTGSGPPVNIPVRNYSPAQTLAMEEFVSKGLANGLICESNSPWSSPALIAQKKDSRPKRCIDYQAVNKATRRNAFSLANVNYEIQKAAGHNFCTSLDLVDGFWQIHVADDSMEKTAFPLTKATMNGLSCPSG